MDINILEKIKLLKDNKKRAIIFSILVFVLVSSIGCTIVLRGYVSPNLQVRSINTQTPDQITSVDQEQSNNSSLEPKTLGISTQESNSKSVSEEVNQAVEEQILENTSENPNLVLVKRVIDGDTIELETGEKVRYIGINTPETVDPDKPQECFGKEASAENKRLVEGQNVRLEKDVSDKDKFNRLLRYVYLEDDTFVNLSLIEEGYAFSSSYPPDIKFQDQFRKAERQARESKTGLWASETCDGKLTSIGNNDSRKDCVIKGNISSSGEKIYHMLGQKYYLKTVINESIGERWFCTEEEAIEAGWRKSKL